MFKGLKSLFAGLLAGATLGILFSPNKGEEIRKKLKSELDQGGSGVDTLKSTVSGFGKDIGKTISEVSDSETYKKGRKEVEKLVKENTTAAQRRKAKSAVKKAKKTVKKAVKDAKNTIDKAKKGLNKK